MRFYYSSGRVAAILLASLVAFINESRGAVVINEVMYHAPGDLEDLEFIELFNSGEAAVDLGNWEFSKGIKFRFPVGTKIGAKGFVVLARNADRFREFYQSTPAGIFSQKLSNDGEHLALADAGGKQVDSVRYKDKAPWPIGPDGYSGSLERIDPASDGENPFNWVSSPLAADHRKPMGTPGKQNAAFAKKLPPEISNVRFAPDEPAPNQTVTVQANVKQAGELRAVALLYRLAGPGYQKPEISVPMQKVSDGLYSAVLPGQAKDQLVRFRVQAVDADGATRTFPAATEPRPAFSYYVHDTIEPAKVPFAWIINTSARAGARNENRNRQFNPFEQNRNQARTPFESAFIYYDLATHKTQLFDFVQVRPRKAGQKVVLYSDQPLEEMTSLNLIFEYDERMLFTEPMAYEVYRRAGMPAEKSYHLRMWVDGQPIGYQLLVEQPNKAFLRRNKMADDGNLYKLLWFGNGVEGQHEKKTNERGGHEDLKTLVKELESKRDREQWEFIRKNFDVEEVANYFAVNTLLTHWDGFFNNYFTYHDTTTGKWTMFPWDQDKTWGITDSSSSVFYKMPLTMGMKGDSPPFGQGFNFNGWWRPPGYFSGPLLANPYFRRVYLSRTKELVESVYTEAVFYPLIDQMGERMREEVRYRAKLNGEDPVNAAQRLEGHLKWLKDHLKKRREFLLAQKELQEAGRNPAK